MAAQHTRYINRLAAQHQVGASFQPSRGGQDADITGGRGHLQQAQLGVALADHAINHHVIEAGDHNTPTGIERFQVAGAIGVNAHLTSLFALAGVDQNVALRRQIALQSKSAGRIDDNTSVGTTGNKVTFERGCPGRVHDHAAI